MDTGHHTPTSVEPTHGPDELRLRARVAEANAVSRQAARMSPVKPQTIIRAAEWTLGPETGEGAPQAIFSVACVTCHEESQPVDDERLPMEIWALKHTGLNPAHRQFRLTTESFWRVTPAPGNPYYDEPG
ncbi:DUF7848 domain-containing protein [Streptomyces sp. KR80]|uniref:DUF7848 domain-containing protein n=1 Tax=Streptomyces sp. KR80 TaxID=3457426 RepID=UPI003FD31C43